MDPIFLGLSAAAAAGISLALVFCFLWQGQRTSVVSQTEALADQAREMDGLATKIAERDVVISRQEAELTALTRDLSDARERLDTQGREIEALSLRKENLARELAVLEAEHKSMQAHHSQRLDEVKSAREEMQKTFRLTAEDILKTSGAELNKQGTERLQVLLTPLREQLGKLEQQVTQDAEKRTAQTTQIATVMQTLHSDAKRMSDEAHNLTRALTSSSKTQGDWGELVLQNILEQAGLREGYEFFTQETKSSEDGRRLRPDIVVEMPGAQRLVIDSKVSLTAFKDTVRDDASEAERGAALKAHITSVRAHIKSLGAKDYAALYEGVNFTLMFIPLEGAASLALQNDPELSTFAWEHGVMIATPTTLMMAMRTVQNLWTIDRQNQNARAIAERAGALYDKFEGFVSDLDAVGNRIDQAQAAWSDARGKLVAGRGNVIRQAEMLKTLGAQTKKALPEDLVAASGAGGDGEMQAPALAAPDES